ncbi:MAG: hypothetical protein RIR62_350 [Pseudomonadota bacterium]|jgi:hypothetical protein
MTETFAALLFAHVLADFVLQPDRMVRGKRKPLWLAAHGAVVLVTAVLATGNPHPALLAMALAHLAIDIAKRALGGEGLAAFLTDQAAHLATLVLTAALLPDLWSGGVWSTLTPLPALMAVAAGAVLAIRAGGFAIGLLMAPFAARITLDGLPGGGRAIGHLERGLIFLMILGGLPEGIGFLIAAKSVLRFGTVKEEARLSEYVIIGTLASFGWAMLAAWATLALVAHLPPLGIPAFPP